MSGKRSLTMRFSPNGNTANIINISSETITKIGIFKSVSIDTIVVPVTYYMISSINNTFLLRENAGAWSTVTITPGSYTSTQFAAELKNRLEDIGAGTYAVTFIEYTGSIKITVSGAVATFSISFLTGDTQKEKIFGIPNNTAGASYTIQNPPAAAQINNTRAASYTSNNQIPPIIIIDSTNSRALLSDVIGTWNMYTLTSGSYTNIEFAAHLKVRLNATGTGTYNTSILQNGRLFISVSGAALTFSISFITSINKIEDIYGVDHNTTGATNIIQNPPTAAQINNVASYTSTLPTQLWGPDVLYLTSNALDSLTIGRYTDANTLIEDIICQIPINASIFSQMIYRPELTLSCVSNTRLKSTFDFNIIDEDGNDINFNGGNCYLTLRFE
uniref:Uncharacterized protein n=1 Tax=viral metagenome TaxID=1070528 RepID=A0A6C0BC81_9ZZZZ